MLILYGFVLNGVVLIGFCLFVNFYCKFVFMLRMWLRMKVTFDR